MKGVILAAGKGSRLYPITHHIPKPLLPLANRPTVHYAFDRLKEIGVTQICLVVGENEQQMKAALGDGRNCGIEIWYVKQAEPKGLAHAVGFASDFVGSDDFILYLGDAVYGDTLSGAADKFRSSSCANLNLVKPVDDPRRYGVAYTTGDRIFKLIEKPAKPESNLAMAGVYFFRRELWDVLSTLKPSARGEYEITDAIQLLIDAGHPVLAFEYDGAWFDSGTLDSFLKVSEFLTDRVPLIEGEVYGGVGAGTVVGEGAVVKCHEIKDSVVLPGAEVSVTGRINRCILAGKVDSENDLTGQIAYGNESITIE